MIERGVRILPVATLVSPWSIEDLKRQLDEADHQVFLLSRENERLREAIDQLQLERSRLQLALNEVTL